MKKRNKKNNGGAPTPNPPNPPITIPFSEQIGPDFNIGAATWAMSATNYARNQSAEGWTTYPPGVENPTQVSWHNPLEPISDSLCGFIGTISGFTDGINRIQIAIRGTQTAAVLVSDVDYSQIPYTNSTIVGNVHKGFYGVYTDNLSNGSASLQTQIVNAFTGTYLSSTQKNRIYITGHSLGAAVATLIMADLATRFPESEIICYTFASPRVGDPSFSNSLYDYIINRPYWLVHQRVFNTDDVVPGLPPVITTDTPPLLYQHTNSYFGSFVPSNSVNLSTGFSFSTNLGSIELNHQICTYYAGAFDGTQSCPPNPSSEVKGKKKKKKKN
jgi:hypothetical protein